MHPNPARWPVWGGGGTWEEEWHRPPNTEAREEEAPVRLVPAIEAGMRSRRQPGRRMGACRCYTEGQGGGGPAVQLGPVW